MSYVLFVFQVCMFLTWTAALMFEIAYFLANKRIATFERILADPQATAERKAKAIKMMGVFVAIKVSGPKEADSYAKIGALMFLFYLFVSP